VSVRELVTTIAEICEFHGRISYDTSKSGGDARRSTSVDRAAHVLGFQPSTSLEEGLRETVAWYRAQLGVGVA
jgi:GDP-L-fucose synthase